MPYSDPAEQRRYQREHAARRRAAYFADKSCARCGSTEDLQLHHVYRASKTASAIWTWGARRREAELAKCVVICHACHQEEHREEMRQRAVVLNTTLPRDERGRNRTAA